MIGLSVKFEKSSLSMFDLFPILARALTSSDNRTQLTNRKCARSAALDALFQFLNFAFSTPLFHPYESSTSVELKSELKHVFIKYKSQILICFQYALRPRVMIAYTYTFQLVSPL
jgi:hypothetical protein